MKHRERILLGVFAVLFLVIVGGGLVTFGVNHYREVSAEAARLRERLVEMSQAVTEGAEWQRRSEWLDAHVPQFATRQEASARLLEVLQKQADIAGVTLASREFVETARPVEDGSGGAGDDGGYFDKAQVRITLTAAREQAFFAWVHGFQKPDSFLGVTRLQINPSGQNKTINVELEVTQFYRENPAAAPVRAAANPSPEVEG